MKNERKQGIISAALAFFTCFSLCGGYFLTEPLWGDSVSVMTAFLFAALCVLYKKAFFPIEKRRLLVSLCFGFIMGFMIYLGAGYVRDVMLAASLAGFFAALVSLTLFFAAMVSMLLRALPAIGAVNVDAKARLDSLAERFDRRCGMKTYLAVFLMTGIFFFLTFLAVYPGIYSYDASVQVLQFFGDKPVTNHHPLLHTLFLCGSLKLGNVLFGSWQAGMVIHSILQALIMDAVFSYVIWRMIKEKRPAFLIAFTYLFLVVNPYIRIMVFITTKDVLFGAAFLLAFLWAADMVRDVRDGKGKRFFQSGFLQFRFFLAVLFMCFLRNQGIYVFLFFALIFFLYQAITAGKTEKGQLRPSRWLLCAVLTAAFYGLVTGPVYSLLGVEPGDMREMLSVPMQQLARAYNEEPEQLSEEEKEYIREVILPESLEQYVSVNADPVKSGFQTDVLKADPKRFAGTWLSVGLKTPLVYLDSFCLGNWGYWYPEETQYWINYIVFDGAFMEAEYNVLNIRRDSRLPRYEERLRELSLTPAFEDIPVLSLLLNQAFPFWMMLVTAAVCIFQRKYRALIPLTLILGYWGTLLLGPVTSVRYAFPLMLCVPALLAVVLDAASDPAPDTASDAASNTASDTASDASSDPAPDTAPDTASDAGEAESVRNV